MRDQPKSKIWSRAIFFSLISLSLQGCLGVPDGVKVADDFELERYLGTWHEIARLDHSFERGLSRVTAEYSMREDGGVRVINRGYDAEKESWDEAEGKAYFVGDESVGALKVSFFGPFFGAYNVAVLDPAYQYAMVVGPDTSYLWILARDPKLDPAIVDHLVDQAAGWGFPTDELIFPEHKG